MEKLNKTWLQNKPAVQPNCTAGLFFLTLNQYNHIAMVRNNFKLPLTFNLLHGATVFVMIFSEVRVEQNARAFTRSFLR